MKLLAIIKWGVFFLLLAAAAIAGGGTWLWSQRHDFTRDQVLAAFEKVAPDLRLHLDAAQLLSPAHVRLDGVTLQDSRSNPVFRCEQVLLTLDETELLERQRVVVRSVLVKHPEVLAVRDHDGLWNWQTFRFQRYSENAVHLPQVTFENLRLQLRLEHTAGLPPASLLLTSSRLLAIPTSALTCDVAGEVVLPGAGMLSLNGNCDLETGRWQVAGNMSGIRADRQLTDIARTASPDVTTHLEAIDALVSEYLPPTDHAAAAVTTGLLIGSSSTSPRFLGELDVQFEAHSMEDGMAPEFQLKVDIRDGHLISPATPVQLNGVAATFFWNNRQVVCRVENATVENATVRGAFTVDSADPQKPPSAELHISGLRVTSELRPLCPPEVQRFFDHFEPEGLVDLDTQLLQSPSGKWRPVGLTATARDSHIRFHKFQYPVTGIEARFLQRTMDVESDPDTVIDVDFTGMGGSRPVTGKGVIRNPGPEAEMLFEVGVTELPVDPQFRAALDGRGQRVLDSLNITGLVTATARCYRPPGPAQPTQMLLKGDVTAAQMRFRGFPYQIRELSGSVEFDSRNRSWKFENLAGGHGSARLAAAGSFRGSTDPGTLDLRVTVKDGQLDADLYNALGPSQRDLWQMLQPRGTVNLTTEIAWTAAPGQLAIVRLPEIELINTEIYPRPFPLRMLIRNAKLSFDPNDPRFAGVQHCAIESVQAEHNGVPLSATGWAELTPDHFWQLHFNDLTAGRLSPNDDVRAALPASWRPALALFAQQGHISIDSSQIDFRGRTTGEAPPTAAWDIQFQLHDCEINAGLDLTHVTGQVNARGHWDGYDLQNSGDINLTALEVLEMPISRISGPYSLDNYELLLGSREVFTERAPLRVPPERRIQATAYGGHLLADGVVELSGAQEFRIFTNIDNALLERYAQLHIPDQPGLKGVISAWLYLRGDGSNAQMVSGNGQLRISPAALYEVPVIVQLFSALSQINFAAPSRTAFDYALLTFDVHDRAFWFNPIDLVGESLALRGRGRVGFGGDVVLDFFSRPPKPRGPSIPLANLLLSGATQWVGVQVRGTTERPQTMVRSSIQLDESMRQFLAAFQPNPGGTIPAIAPPGFLALPVFPQAMLPRSPGPGQSGLRP